MAKNKTVDVMNPEELVGLVVEKTLPNGRVLRRKVDGYDPSGSRFFQDRRIVFYRALLKSGWDTWRRECTLTTWLKWAKGAKVVPNRWE